MFQLSPTSNMKEKWANLQLTEKTKIRRELSHVDELVDVIVTKEIIPKSQIKVIRKRLVAIYKLNGKMFKTGLAGANIQPK